MLENQAQKFSFFVAVGWIMLFTVFMSLIAYLEKRLTIH